MNFDDVTIMKYVDSVKHFPHKAGLIEPSLCENNIYNTIKVLAFTFIAIPILGR